MSPDILYLAPPPFSKNGIADYAVCYRGAVETYTDWRLRQVDVGKAVAGDSLRDLKTLRQRVQRWKTDGTLRGVAFVHAEVGYKQHDLFYTLFWLKRLLPTLPYCITIHDPPLVVAPAFKPLCLGMNATLVRRSCRVLDYTPMGRWIIRSVLANAAHLFVLSHRGKDALQAVLGAKAPISWLPFINYRQTRPAAPERYEADPTTILFSGFWSKGKGIEILLRAMECIHASDPASARLWMTGGAEQSTVSQRYVASMLKAIHDSPACPIVDVRGYTAPEAMDATFDAAHIFVLPTTARTGYSASSVLFRAMAAGLPIVASDVGMAGEEILDWDTGLLVPPGDANALTDALLRLIRSHDLRSHLGLRAQEHAFTEHGQEHIARQAATCYRSIVGGT